MKARGRWKWNWQSACVMPGMASGKRRNFFFQAEDGIRCIGVTGVQTCALPIYDNALSAARAACRVKADKEFPCAIRGGSGVDKIGERRVGKECRSRWSPYH